MDWLRLMLTPKKISRYQLSQEMRVAQGHWDRLFRKIRKRAEVDGAAVN